MPKKYAKALGFVDIESDGLPDGHDFSMVNILEFALIVTNMDLTPVAGYHEVVKMTRPAAERVSKNDLVKKMHQESGLLADSIKGTHTLAEVEQEAIETLQEKGIGHEELMLAGSGIAMFDFPLIKTHMPEFAKYLTYYPMDIGIHRRLVKIFAGVDLINPVTESFQDGVKKHRAYSDAEAHLKEASRARDYYQGLAKQQAAQDGPW
jgi:oligoribonuclease (3'-5' exoribonuclease)